MPADCCYLGEHTALVRLRTGKKMYVDTRDVVVSPHLLLDGEWEKWVTEIVWRNLRPGDVFVDVGAHLGWYTLLGAERVGPKGDVIAFEPNGGIYELLCRSLLINGFSNVVPLSKVVSDRTTHLPFRQDPGYSGWGHVDAPEVPYEKRLACQLHALLPAITLTEALQGRDHVHLVKIDAEHHEMAILAGARGLVERCRPMLIVEHHPGAPTDEPSWLLERGYSLHAIEHDSTLTKLALEDLVKVGDGEMLLFVPPRQVP